MRKCKQCDASVHSNIAVYCSNRCQVDYQYSSYIQKWKDNQVSGERGVIAKTMSMHIYKYLALKFKNSCSLCGWAEVNQFTGKTPLEIDHIDGDSTNNVEDNLRLICPNCHSLTASFRNLNKGNGRSWRRNKYLKSV